MNTYAVLVVNQHLETLRAEAAMRRSFRVERPSLASRLATAVTTVKSVVATPIEANIGLPALNDYPYRG